MSEQYVVSPENAIYQLTNAFLALSNVLSKIAPEPTQGYIAMAIEASKQQGYGAELIEEVYKKVFPDAGPNVVLSPEEFAAKFGTPKA